MNVFILVHHYDRGSDEVSVEGVYSTLEKAREAFAIRFKGWVPNPDVVDEMGREYTPDHWWFLSDPEDSDSCDRAMIMHHPVDAPLPDYYYERK